jgi:hypothetical protein
MGLRAVAHCVSQSRLAVAPASFCVCSFRQRRWEATKRARHLDRWAPHRRSRCRPQSPPSHSQCHSFWHHHNLCCPHRSRRRPSYRRHSYRRHSYRRHRCRSHSYHRHSYRCHSYRCRCSRARWPRARARWPRSRPSRCLAPHGRSCHSHPFPSCQALLWHGRAVAMLWLLRQRPFYFGRGGRRPWKPRIAQACSESPMAGLCRAVRRASTMPRRAGLTHRYPLTAHLRRAWLALHMTGCWQRDRSSRPCLATSSRRSSARGSSSRRRCRRRR